MSGAGMADNLEPFARLRRKSAPQLLAEHARDKGDVVAFRSKCLGIYRERTWGDYAALVGACALGMRALQLDRGERVAIMGNACEEWVICDLAAQSLGAITYGIYPTASISEVRYQMLDGGAAIFVAENQEYVDKILAIIDELPQLRWVIVIDEAAMFAYRHPKLRTYFEIIALGRGTRTEEECVSCLQDMAQGVNARDPAFIVYTSGTTGNPKGALISHGKHLAGAFTIVDHYPTLARCEHRTVVFLPLCHIFGRDVAITLPLISRLVPHFGEDVEGLSESLFEVAPTVLFMVPRYAQKFASQILVGVNNTGVVKHAAYAAAMSLGRICARRRWARKHPAPTAVLALLARCLCLPRHSRQARSRPN